MVNSNVTLSILNIMIIYQVRKGSKFEISFHNGRDESGRSSFFYFFFTEEFIDETNGELSPHDDGRSGE